MLMVGRTFLGRHDLRVNCKSFKNPSLFSMQCGEEAREEKKTTKAFLFLFFSFSFTYVLFPSLSLLAFFLYLAHLQIPATTVKPR